MIDSQAEKLRELDQEMRPFRQSWEEAGGVRSSVESLQSRVAELESVDKGAGQAVRNTGEGGGSGGPGTGGAHLTPPPVPQVSAAACIRRSCSPEMPLAERNGSPLDLSPPHDAGVVGGVRGDAVEGRACARTRAREGPGSRR